MRISVMNPSDAYSAANSATIRPMLIGLVIGSVIGFASKKHIPTWQILSLAFAVLVIANLIDFTLSTRLGQVVPLGISTMVVAMFGTRKTATTPVSPTNQTEPPASEPVDAP